MKRSKYFSVGLAAWTGVFISTGAAFAHNTVKYSNVPFIVAAYCTENDPAVSSKIVSANGKVQLQVVIDSPGNSGFDMYCSSPSTGTLPTTTTGSLPEGVLTFTMSSSTAGVGVGAGAYYVDDPATFITSTTSVVGNTATVYANTPTTPGANVLNLVVFPVTTSSTATVLLSNFRYNNTPVLFDTTVSDINNNTGASFCDFIP